MPFLDPPFFELVDDRSDKPWKTTSSRRWQDPLTGEVHTIPSEFRTDGSSVPKLLMMVPLIGRFLALRFMGKGLWLGFGEGVLHDYLRRPDFDGLPPVPAAEAHLKFKRALEEAGYPYDMVENYYAAVKRFNS